MTPPNREFSDDFSTLINESASLMLTQKQRRLTVFHICYGFFTNPLMKKVASKHIINITKLIDDILENTKNGLKDGSNLDLDDDTKLIIRKCASQDPEKKFTSFDFIEFASEEDKVKLIFDKYGVNKEVLARIKLNYKRESIKKAMKPQKRSVNDLKDDKPAIDKHSVENFITDITAKVKKNRPLILDYDNKIDEILNTLLRKEKSNPLLVGKPGVGKSSLVEGLALALLDGKAPESLSKKKIIEIHLNSMIAGTNFRGDFEKRFENIITYLKQEGNVIIFIDEIHCMKGLGATSASKTEMDFSNMLKPYLSSGEISCIGATTHDEYKQSIEKDKALDRRFKVIQLREPTVEETKVIVSHKKSSYETFHKVKISTIISEKIVDLTNRFISKGSFPDKAFDVIDMCAALATMKNKRSVDESIVVEIISKLTNVKRDQISGVATSALILENGLKAKIFGQDKAIKDIADKIMVAKSGLTNPLKPLASFLMIGTTGVGKTEVVNEISKQMNMQLLRLDMSEYSEKGSVSKLIGTSAGYVGYEDGGKLTDYVSNHPHSVILFDEIEKADRSIYNLFLQILDYGKITDGSGREIDFRNTLIFMTSNAGVEALDSNTIGFISSDDIHSSKFEKEVNKIFPPEFRNRLSKIITFEKLKKETMVLLVDKNLTMLTSKMKEKGIELSYDQSVKDIIIKNGFNEKLGARPLERYIEDNLVLSIVKNMLTKSIKEKNKYLVNFVNDEFKFKLIN
jgi:ATP-dependent Clp protease ATP-binding subunit ClpA